MDANNNNNNNSNNSDLFLINEYLKSVEDIKSQLLKTNTHLCHSSSSKKGSFTEPCKCVFKHLDQLFLFDTALVKLFMERLNGNLFKLKDFYVLLSKTLASLNSSKLNCKQNENLNHESSSSSSSSSQLHLFEFNSVDSYTSLSEINKFLHSPCIVNMFKSAVIYNNSRKSSSSDRSEYEYDENFNRIEAKSYNV